MTALLQSTLCRKDTNRAHFTKSTILGLFSSFINVLSIFHSDVRGKHEYPRILFQLNSNFTARLTVFTDKTGIKNNIPKRGILTRREGS